MKNLILTTVVIALFTPNAFAGFFGLPDLNFLNKKFTEIQAKFAEEINGIKIGQLSMVAELTGIKSSIGVMNATINAQTQIMAKMQAQIGYQNTNETSVGHDQTTTTTNDTAIFKAIMSGMGTIIAGLLFYIRMLSKQRSDVEKKLFELLNRQEEGQNKYIELLENIAKTTLDKLLENHKIDK